MLKLIQFAKKNWAIILILVIAAVAYHRWLNFSIFSYADQGYSFRETILEFLHPSVWWSNSDMGGNDLVFWMVPIKIALALISWLGFEMQVADKIVIFWLFAFLTPVASFLLAKKILKNDTAALISSVVFSYNTYFLAINTQGHLLLALAAPFSVLAIWLYITALEKAKLSYFLLSSIPLAISGFYDFRILYISFFIMFFYLVYFIALINRDKAVVKKIVGFSFAAFIFLAALNMFWIIPFTMTDSLANNDIMERNLTLSGSFDIARSITLFHPFWSGTEPVWFKTRPIPLYFWLIPALALAGLWCNRRNKRIIFFGLVALLGILLSKQSSDPWGYLYHFLHTHLPGFKAFREASKFYFLTALGYSILIGSFVLWLEGKKWKKIGGKIIVNHIIIVIIAAIFLWNTQSMITGKIKTLFIPSQIPPDNLTVRKFIIDQPEFFRVLWMPSQPRFSTATTLHPRINAVEMKRADWEKFSKNYGQGNNLSTEERLVYVLKQPYSDNLLDLSSIKYIVVASKKGDAYYISELEKIDYLKKIDAGSESVVMFENDNYRPHIYLTKELETIHRRYGFSRVSFDHLSPSRYEIRIKNMKEPVYLNFSEKFNDGWKLHAGSFSWMETFKKGHALDDRNHFINDADFNSFRLDPNELKKTLSKDQYKTNPDGSLDIMLTLYFAPQGGFYAGASISLFSFLAVVAYISVSFFRKNKNNNHYYQSNGN